MTENNIGVVKEGLLATGLFFLLLAALTVPVVNLAAIWFLPLPFLILKAKQRLLAFILPVLFIGIILYLFPSPALAFLSLFALVVGLTMGHFYARETASGTDVVLSGLVAGLIGVWAILFAGQYWFGMIDGLRKSWEAEWAYTKRMLETAGVLPADFTIPPIESFIPVLLLFLLIPMALLNFWVGRRWLQRFQFPGKYLPAFREWRLPRPFFFFYVVMLALSLFMEANPSTLSILLGVLWVLQTLFLIQAFSFLSFFLHHYHKSNAWLILAFLILMTRFSVILQLLGMLDAGTRLREKIKQRD
ncbi:DUF2232 domain-containing protein [Lihuaxuella thermophila]|uniref:Uncharacterized conserved protein YybS, DUF2232 family n=1 Tax=Lihuaxuella thermophila TaxID=1173111 RepID=A0A1H8BL64_9BACL|nr:DUF2232 domain-containing protein [Lihuaxuella thermophila]SEM82798.1 Uncharacterized conserved protein YybS, DUF2232 family [Lihuaxuella thermophila]